VKLTGFKSPAMVAEMKKKPGSGANLVEVIKELVAANRLLFRQGVVDAYGHVSARHPQIPDAFLIASGKTPALVSADHIVELDLDGREIRGIPQSLYLERFIHAEIYRARSDVGAVVRQSRLSIIPKTTWPLAS